MNTHSGILMEQLNISDYESASSLSIEDSSSYSEEFESSSDEEKSADLSQELDLHYAQTHVQAYSSSGVLPYDTVPYLPTVRYGTGVDDCDWQKLLYIMLKEDFNKEIINSIENAKRLNNILKQGTVEVELRIRGLSEKTFKKTEILGGKFNHFVVEIFKIKGKEDVSIRKYIENQQEQLKENIWYKKFHNKIKLCLSLEKPYKQRSGSILVTKKDISRWSTDFKSFRIDRSKIVVKSKNQEDKIRYELEFEFRHDIPVQSTVQSTVQSAAQSGIAKILSDIKFLIANVVLPKRIARGIPKTIFDLVPPVNLRRYKFPKPVNLHLRDILYRFKQGGSISLKADGLRVFAIIGIYGTFFITTSLDVMIGSFKIDNKFSIADGELVKDKMFVFDVMFYKGKPLYNKSLKERTSYISDFCKLANENLFNDAFVPKEHIFFENYETFIEAMVKINDISRFNYLNHDGMIFTLSGEYNDKVFKWKNKDTIDFLYSDNSLKITQISQGKLEYIDSGFSLLCSNNDVLQGADGLIIECIVDPKEKKARAVTLRYDKKFPNSLKVLSSVIESIKNKNKTKDIFKGEPGIILMRAYHNDIKRKILKNLKGVIVDVGTGRGGDLSKWKHLEKVFCIEPDATNLDIMKNRLKEINSLNNIEIIQHKATILGNRNLFPKKSIDAVTCFFCLNLMLEEDLNQLLRDSSEILKKGAFFVFIAVSKKLMKEAVDNKRISSCSKYEISMESDTSYVIDIPRTYVVKQKENLLDFDIFIKKAEKYGFVKEINFPIRCGCLNDNVFLSEEEKNLSRLFELAILRMSV